MKKSQRIFLLIMLMLSILAGLNSCKKEDNCIKNTYSFKKEITIISDTLRTHKGFLKLFAQLESNNNYSIINKFGYMGKYQIGRQALIEIGFGGISQEDFINTPELQEIAMNFLLKKNKKFLRNYIGKYNSTTIKGIYITESGILAGAHALGHVAVIKWLESKGQIDSKDANKIKVSTRIKQFSGYNLKL